MFFVSKLLLVAVFIPNYGQAAPTGRDWEAMMETVNQLQSKVEKLEAKQARDGEVIAFSVALDGIRNFGAQEQITFDRVITNIGGDYSPQQHEFVCRRTGLYQFSFSSLSERHDNSAHFDLWMGGTQQSHVFAAGQARTASNSVVVECPSGSKVFVTCWRDGGCNVLGNEDRFPNPVMFSGFLISASD